MCHPLSQCLHLVVHNLYLYLLQEYHTAVTLLLSEACIFVIRKEDCFDCHVGKRVSKIVVGHPLNSSQAKF